VASIVDDLLDLSRIEEAPPGRLESVDLASVVGEVVDRVGPTAERRHIALDVEVPGGVGVAGSRGQLLSLVRNLVENAVKYSDGGTTVAVRVSRDADDAVVEVADRGIGIPAADLDRVFERFYRVDRARTRETGGSGLGLSIVRHVVQAHGGTVRLASTEGEGTTVTVRLPAGGAAA
jgi:two-component system sensor histidine kinase SenX3